MHREIFRSRQSCGRDEGLTVSHQQPTAVIHFSVTRQVEELEQLLGRWQLMSEVVVSSGLNTAFCSKIKHAHLLIKYELLKCKCVTAVAFPDTVLPCYNTATVELKPIFHTCWQFSTNNKTKSTRCNISKCM